MSLSKGTSNVLLVSSYANEKSNLITIKLEEAKGSKLGNLVFTFVAMLLVWASMHHFTNKAQAHAEYNLASFGAPGHPSSTGWMQAEVPIEGSHPKDSSKQEARGDSSDSEGGKLDVYWEEPTPAERCSAYGTREYSARLWDLSFFASWKGACNNTPIVINGQTFANPERCESRVSAAPPSLSLYSPKIIDQWPFGGVIGYWKVPNQKDCSPQWGRVVEKESATPPMPASSS